MGWRVRGIARLAIAIALACASDARAASDAPGDDATLEIMREIYAGIRVALPASADPAGFRAVEGRAEIAAALDRLALHAALLEDHAASDDPQMRFLAGSIARDAREVQSTFQAGRSERAAYLVQRITENCIVCHTRLPSGEDSPRAAGFVDAGVLAELSLEARASLQMATRRFDDALVSLETLLASREHPAMLLGPLTDYLVVSLRVKGDFARPLPVLRRFAARDDVWTQLRHDVERWIRALPELAPRAEPPPDVAVARQLLAEADALDADGGRAGLVHRVVASSLLQRLLAGPATSPEQLAEAYYRLGLVEAEIGRNYWVTAAPFLLETSIRLSPRGPHARAAFARLEEELVLANEGSDFVALAPADRAYLEELRALIEAR